MRDRNTFYFRRSLITIAGSPVQKDYCSIKFSLSNGFFKSDFIYDVIDYILNKRNYSYLIVNISDSSIFSDIITDGTKMFQIVIYPTLFTYKYIQWNSYYLISILTKIKHPSTFNSLINKYIRTYREKIATTISLSPKKVINPVLKRVLSRIYIFHFFFFFFLSHSERRRGSPTRSPMLEIYSRSPGVSRVYKCMGSKWPN